MLILAMLALAVMTPVVDAELLRASAAGAVAAGAVATMGALGVAMIGGVLSRAENLIDEETPERWDVRCMMWTSGCAAMAALGAGAGGAALFQWMWAAIGALVLASTVQSTSTMHKRAGKDETGTDEADVRVAKPERARASRALVIRTQYARWTRTAPVPAQALENRAKRVNDDEIARGRTAARWDRLGAEARQETERRVRAITHMLVAEAFEREVALAVTEEEALAEVAREGAFAERCAQTLVERWRARDRARRQREVFASAMLAIGGSACAGVAVAHASAAVTTAVCVAAASMWVSVLARGEGMRRERAQNNGASGGIAEKQGRAR